MKNIQEFIFESSIASDPFAKILWVISYSKKEDGPKELDFYNALKDWVNEHNYNSVKLVLNKNLKDFFVDEAEWSLRNLKKYATVDEKTYDQYKDELLNKKAKLLYTYDSLN